MEIQKLYRDLENKLYLSYYEKPDPNGKLIKHSFKGNNKRYRSLDAEILRRNLIRFLTLNNIKLKKK